MSDEIKNALFTALCEVGLKVPQGLFSSVCEAVDTTSAAQANVLLQVFMVSVSEIVPEGKA